MSFQLSQVTSTQGTVKPAPNTSAMEVLFKLLNGGMKDAVVKPSPMPVQPAVPNAPTENDLIARVASGHVTADQLVTQLKSVSVTPSQRDAITTVLKFLNRQHSQPLIPHRTTLTPSPTPQKLMLEENVAFRLADSRRRKVDGTVKNTTEIVEDDG
ncbi:hypothetical protein E2C01_033225 [Portunus trituberculatus]|uniref:Uncharacterized protein n=1 Tax=Portunus trituberculatus TaxID=210409 RepID=A0A5B7EXB3_PORTR|nr:hypothetical protein [Portunus trituberculatus]